VGPAERRYATPAEEFSLSELRVLPGTVWRSPAERSAEVLVCVKGAARLVDGRDRCLELARGRAAFAPACAGSYRVEGEATLFRAAPADSVWGGARAPAD
jgi:mannose-6-phosphate isomerase class I